MKKYSLWYQLHICNAYKSLWLKYDDFDLKKQSEKCLEEQNFAVAREDLNKNLTENINGKSSATYGSNLKRLYILMLKLNKI